MTPPIDILDIASERVHRIREKLLAIGWSQSCPATTRAYEQALYELALAERDISKARDLGQAIDDAANAHSI